MDPVLLYITSANREEAISIAHELLSERLIACANIVENATSMYWWQGEIEQEKEALIIAKTVATHIEQITARVKALHSYENPCVITMPITGGNPEYIEWINNALIPLQK